MSSEEKRTENGEISLRKRIKDLVSETEVSKCISCGECTSACPVASIADDFSPRRMVAEAMIDTEEEARNLIESGDVWTCTTCEICNLTCPYGVDLVNFVSKIRELAADEGVTPSLSPCLGAFMTRRLRTGKAGNSKRMNWVSNDIEVSDEGDVYYFSGCTSFLELAYKDRKNIDLGNIPRSAVKILNSVGVVPAVSKEEECCGHDLFWMGETEKARELAESNIETIRESGAETVVFSCPEGLRTFRENYEDLLDEDINLNFVHISEFLQDKDIPLRGEWEEEKITYHDSCRLKHLEIFEEPREILDRVPNVSVKEMERNREKSPCCGVSAMARCGPISREMEAEKLKEAEESGASKLVVPCSKCLIHLDCAMSENTSLVEDLEIEEFTNFLAAHLMPT